MAHQVNRNKSLVTIVSESGDEISFAASEFVAAWMDGEDKTILRLKGSPLIVCRTPLNSIIKMVERMLAKPTITIGRHSGSLFSDI